MAWKSFLQDQRGPRLEGKKLTQQSMSLRTADKLKLNPSEEEALMKEKKREERRAKYAEQQNRPKMRSGRENEETSRKVSPAEDAEMKSESENAESEDADVESENEEANEGRMTSDPADFMTRNNMSVKNTSSAAVRFGVSDSATAAIATGYLQDLIENGHLDPSKSYLAVDKYKMQRGRLEAIKSAADRGERSSKESEIKGIFFDGRKDRTKTMEFDEKTMRYHQTITKENHISVTSEPDGKYRFHFTPGPSDDKRNKPAKVIAHELHSWMVENGVDATVEVLGGDSTNEMTGWSGGSIVWVEVLLGRKCFWVVCQIHTNELPLRHLITKLDGKSSSKDGFSGPIGKKLSEVNNMKKKSKFKAIKGTEKLIVLPDNIVKDMSTDASLSYKLLASIRSGRLSPELASMKCGKIVHSRWLTTGETLMMLWMSDHGFKGEILRRLKLIVTFVCNVYFPMFFEIKVKNSIVNGPKHIVTLLRLLRSQPSEVVEAVSPYIKTGAWFAHSEAVLLTLLASEKQEERKFGVARVLELRGDQELGDLEPRSRRTPEINFEAKKCQDLIFWEKETIYEPVFTCNLTKTQVKALIHQPLEVPNYPLHTQSTERAVKMTTEASSAVFGFKKRHGYIMSRIESRKAVSSYDYKKNLINMFTK